MNRIPVVPRPQHQVLRQLIGVHIRDVRIVVLVIAFIDFPAYHGRPVRQFVYRFKIKRHTETHIRLPSGKPDQELTVFHRRAQIVRKIHARARTVTLLSLIHI